MNAITELITESFAAADKLERAHTRNNPAANHTAAESLRKAAKRMVDELASQGDHAEAENNANNAMTGAAAVLGALGMALAIEAFKEADSE